MQFKGGGVYGNTCHWQANSVLNWPDGQVKFFEIFKLKKNSNQCSLKFFHANLK